MYIVCTLLTELKFGSIQYILPFLPGIWISENTWLFDVLPERILCGKVYYKAGAIACSTGQDDK